MPIAAESPLHVQLSGLTGWEVSDRPYERSFSTNLETGGRFANVRDDSVVVLDTGATANSVCFKWLGNHNSYLRKLGSQKVAPPPTTARLKCGDGRVGEVRRAADTQVGVAGSRGACTAFALEADIPALLREGAPGALGGQLNFERDILTIRNQGAAIPLTVNETGHYVLSAAAFATGPSCVDRGPNWAASYLESTFLEKRPDLSNGRLRLPFMNDGLIRFTLRKFFRPVRQLLWAMHAPIAHRIFGRLL